MQLPRNKVLQGLKAKGFQQEEGTKHIRLIYFNKSGDMTSISTIVSRGSKYRELGDSLISTMAQQCGLSKQEFVKLVTCTMSQDEYDVLSEQK